MTTATERRLLTQAKQQDAVLVSGDALMKLIQEIQSLRTKLTELQAEVQRNFDTFVEHIPAEMEDGGGIQFKVFGDDQSDDEHPYKRVTLPLAGATVETW